MNLLKKVHLLLNLSMAIGLSYTSTTPVFAAEEIFNGELKIKVSDIEKIAQAEDPSSVLIPVKVITESGELPLSSIAPPLGMKEALNRLISIDLSKPLTKEQSDRIKFIFPLEDPQIDEALKLLAEKANDMTILQVLKALPVKTITPENLIPTLRNWNPKPVSPPPITLEFPNIGIASGFTLTGSAHQIGNRLRLTNWYSQAGTAFLTDRISLAENASFSTRFSFQISSSNGAGDADGPGADGLAFVIQTLSNNVGGAGGGIGYAGIGQSVAIEFDTYYNKYFDPNGNHIGLNLNGNLYSTAWTPVYPRMNNGGIWHSWVDYNGLSKLLEVRISTTENRPINPALSYVLDIASILKMPNAFMGFTSGTGGGMGVHDILSWDVKNQYDPNFKNSLVTAEEVPEPISTLGTLTGLSLIGWIRRRKNQKNIEVLRKD
jgi:Legume lectin domain